jgi:tRNA(Arg) A34 adenosine deaminase TadA
MAGLTGLYQRPDDPRAAGPSSRLGRPAALRQAAKTSPPLPMCPEMSPTARAPETVPTPMRRALALARQAASVGEVPVGAVLVDSTSGAVLAATYNRVETDGDPTAHAELLAIRAAAAVRGRKWLNGCDLYVTLEPCAMCAAGIALARLRRVYFGAYDPKGGGVEHGARVFDQPQCNWKPEVIGGLDERACGALLEDFFRRRR